jgi:hypothetical protein
MVNNLLDRSCLNSSENRIDMKEPGVSNEVKKLFAKRDCFKRNQATGLEPGWRAEVAD